MLSSAAVLLLLLITLAACSSGSAREAEEARADDETSESVVADRQATYTATMIAQGTPTPMPERPPIIAALVLTNQVNGDGSPVGEFEGFAANAGTIYLCAQVSGLRAGSMAAALRDRGQQRAVLAYNEVEVEGGGGLTWVAIPIDLNGSLSPGDYPIWMIFDPGGEDEEWLQSLVFQIGPLGSGAQQVGNADNLSPRESGSQAGDSLSPGNQSTEGNAEDDIEDSPPIQPRVE